MDWNMYCTRARFPFLDPHLSWPRLSYNFSCQPFPPSQVHHHHQDPFQPSAFQPLHHFGNESKFISNPPSTHFPSHLHHQQNYGSPFPSMDRLTIDINSRFLPSHQPSLPSHVTHPLEPVEQQLLPCPVNLSSGTHLQTLHNVVPSTATSFLPHQLCDSALAIPFGLPSPCHTNSVPSYSPRVDTPFVPALLPPLPQDSNRVPIDQKPNIPPRVEQKPNIPLRVEHEPSSHPLASSAFHSLRTEEEENVPSIFQELKPIKKETVDVESSSNKGENYPRSEVLASEESPRIPLKEVAEKEKKKDSKVSTDLKQLKFLSSKNVSKISSTQSAVDKVGTTTVEKVQTQGRGRGGGGGEVSPEVKVPTRTIEVQCDGPDWTPVVLRTQVKNRLLKEIKKKDDTDKQNGGEKNGEKSSQSSLLSDDKKSVKKSKQQTGENAEKKKSPSKKQDKLKEEKEGKISSNNLKCKTSLEVKTDSNSTSSPLPSLPLPSLPLPSLPLPSLPLQAKESTTATTETMTQITPKRKLVNNEGTNSKKSKVTTSKKGKKTKLDSCDEDEGKKDGKKSRAKKNVKRAKIDKDEEECEMEGKGKHEMKGKGKHEMEGKGKHEMEGKEGKKVKCIPDQFLRPEIPALTLNKEEMRKCEESRENSLSSSNPLPPPPPLQLIKPSSPAATKNNDKQEAKDKKQVSKCGEIVKSKTSSPISRQRKIKSGLDMIRNKKKKVKSSSSSSSSSSLSSSPSSSPKVNSAEVMMKQSSVTKKLSVNRSIGETVLHRASRLGYLEVVISALSNCDIEAIDARDNAGYTPLHECAARGHFKIAQLLLTHGADVNASAAGGIKPIHDAVEGDHVQLVRLLLSYGADPSISTYAGATPLKLAKSRIMTEFIRGFLSDLNGEASDGKGVLRWKFGSTSSCLDVKPSCQGFDCLANVPREDTKSESGKGSTRKEKKEVKIEESDRPFCPSFWLPPSLVLAYSSNGNGKKTKTGSPSSSSSSSSSSSAETSNYLLLSDVLHHLKLRKEDFFRRYRDQVGIVSVPGEEFDSKATCNQVLTPLPTSFRTTGTSLRTTGTSRASNTTKRRGSQDSEKIGGASTSSSSTSSSSRHHEDRTSGSLSSSTVDVVLYNDSLRSILDIHVVTVK